MTTTRRTRDSPQPSFFVHFFLHDARRRRRRHPRRGVRIPRARHRNPTEVRAPIAPTSPRASRASTSSDAPTLWNILVSKTLSYGTVYTYKSLRNVTAFWRRLSETRFFFRTRRFSRRRPRRETTRDGRNARGAFVLHRFIRFGRVGARFRTRTDDACVLVFLCAILCARVRAF